MPKAKSGKGYYIAPKAQENLDSIYDYTFDTWGEAQAEKYLAQLFASFEKLVANPERGKSHRDLPKGLKYFPCGSHHIIYRIRRQHLEIIRVMHQGMNVAQQMKK